MKKGFFDRNFLIINELARYAPSDERLLSIPFHTNVADSFFTKFILKLEHNRDANNFLIGKNLLCYFQSVNQVLSRLYASHQCLIVNRNHSEQLELTQAQIDFNLYKENMIIEEYKHTLREFISMLRVGIDQLILLLTRGSSRYKKSCDCIGAFLKLIDDNKLKEENKNRKFLIGLNAAANYLKHHPYQFEDPANQFPLLSPAILIIVNKYNKHKKLDKDYKNLEDYFKQELNYIDQGFVSCWISCDFLVKGFNAFYSWVKESSACLI